MATAQDSALSKCLYLEDKRSAGKNLAESNLKYSRGTLGECVMHQPSVESTGFHISGKFQRIHKLGQMVWHCPSVRLWLVATNISDHRFVLVLSRRAVASARYASMHMEQRGRNHPALKVHGYGERGIWFLALHVSPAWRYYVWKQVRCVCKMKRIWWPQTRNHVDGSPCPSCQRALPGCLRDSGLRWPHCFYSDSGVSGTLLMILLQLAGI